MEVYEMPKITGLTNNNFKVLSYFYDNKDNENLVKTTQDEVGKALEMNRSTINYIVKWLKNEGYITQDITRVGRYYLTDKGLKTVELLKEVDKL